MGILAPRARSTMFCCAQTARFQTMTPGCFCSMGRSSRNSIERRGMKTQSVRGLEFVSFRGERMPIYGSCLLFDDQGNKVLIHQGTNSAAAISTASGAQAVVRLGFDLFEEVHHLLTQGATSTTCQHTHTGTSHFASP